MSLVMEKVFPLLVVLQQTAAQASNSEHDWLEVPSIPSLFWAIVVGVASTIVSGFVLGRVERVRAFFRTRRQGWLHRRYVRALVQAVQGRAELLGTKVLCLAVTVAPMLAAFYSQRLSNEAARIIARANATVISFETIGQPTKSSEEARQELVNNVAELRHNITDLKSIRATAVAISIAMYLLTILIWLIWVPLATLRAAFAVELRRITTRLQILASKSELAEFVLAESEVHDEATLREYFVKMRAIADRHEAAQVVSALDLWSWEQESHAS